MDIAANFFAREYINPNKSMAIYVRIEGDRIETF